MTGLTKCKSAYNIICLLSVTIIEQDVSVFVEKHFPVVFLAVSSKFSSRAKSFMWKKKQIPLYIDNHAYFSSFKLQTRILTTPHQSPPYKINVFFNPKFFITLAFGGESVRLLSKFHDNQNITLHISRCKHNTHHSSKYKGKLNRLWLKCLIYHPFPIFTSTNYY